MIVLALSFLLAAASSSPSLSPSSSSGSSSSGSSSASAVRARLDAAAAAIAAGDPDAALAELQPRAPMTFAEYVEHHRLLATARAFVDDVDGAVAVFDELLASEPNFTVPYTASPRVTVAFERARAARRGRLPLAFDLNAPALVAPQTPIAVEVRRRSDPTQAITTLLLDVEVPGSGAAPTTHTLHAVDDDDVVRLTLPAPEITDSSPTDDDGRHGVLLRLQLRGLDVDGVERFVGAPVSVPVGFAATPSIWASPWLWGSAAAVVVAGAVTAVVAVRLATVPDTVDVDVEVQR